MKNYMRNKGFISERFYNKRKEQKNKIAGEITALIFTANVCCLPVSVDSVSNFIKEENNKSVQTYNISPLEEEKKASEDNLNDIRLWIDNVMNENIKKADINNKNGEIIVTNIDDLNKINLDKKIEVRSLRDVEEGYELEVQLK